MFSDSIKAAFSALRLLFKSWLTLPLLATMYAALLVSVYLFVSTREATVTQVALTFGLIVIAPALFFAMQAVSVNYASAPTGLLKKAAYDYLKLIVVTLPLLALTLLALRGLAKIESHESTVTAIRYLVATVIAPLITIQLWVTASKDGLRTLLKRLHRVIGKAFAPQSVLVYACGVLVFGVAPFFLIFKTTSTDRAWLEVSLLALRLLAAAVLMLLGWVTTVGTFSILARQRQ